MLKILFFVALLLLIRRFKKDVFKKKRFRRNINIPDLVEDAGLGILCSITQAMAGIFIIGFLINVVCFFIGLFLFVMFIRDAFVYFW